MNSYNYLESQFNISKNVIEHCKKCESELTDIFKKIDDTAEVNQLKVLNAMQKSGLAERHFSQTTGYGYDDVGREVIESIYAKVFNADDALVRPQLISGTHALTVALFGNLRHGDEILSPVSQPYDTLLGVIGIRKTKGSLMEHGIGYKQVNFLCDGSIDYDGIKNAISNKTKLVTIQRSKGYSFRRSLDVAEIGEIIRFVKNIRSDIICMVDNCYGEFVDELEPSDVGADLTVGSLIKNPGGGLAPVGGYIVGKKEYVENAAYRLTAPGLGKEVGPMLGVTSQFTQGLFYSPYVVAASLKGAVFSAKVFSELGYEVLPTAFDKRSDIVQAIKLGSPERVISFCRGIQAAAAVDSFVVPSPWDMPGYDCQVIMAAGAFVQGSSIELSADAPIKEPYVVYFQGGLNWAHAKAGVCFALDSLVKSNNIVL